MPMRFLIKPEPRGQHMDGSSHPLGRPAHSLPPWLEEEETSGKPAGALSLVPPASSASSPRHRSPWPDVRRESGELALPLHPSAHHNGSTAMQPPRQASGQVSGWLGQPGISFDDLAVLWRLTDGDSRACAELVQRLRGVSPETTLVMLRAMLEGGTPLTHQPPDRIHSSPDPWLAMRFGPQHGGISRTHISAPLRTAPQVSTIDAILRGEGETMRLRQQRLAPAGKPRAPSPRTPPNVLREPFLHLGDDALSSFLHGAVLRSPRT